MQIKGKVEVKRKLDVSGSKGSKGKLIQKRKSVEVNGKMDLSWSKGIK